MGVKYRLRLKWAGKDWIQGGEILRIYGPLVEQGILRKRTNREFRELDKDTDKVTDFKRETLEWTGYVVRTDQGSAVKKISESKPVGSRRGGRPRLRWLEEVEKDVREVKGSGDRRQSIGKNGRQ
jgi:hypothetical protein